MSNTDDRIAFGAFDLHDLQAAFTRPVFRHHLVQNWIPALTDVQAKLSAGLPVRIAEVGCGTGQATRSLAALGCMVTAVELGERMARVARQRLAQFANDIKNRPVTPTELMQAGDPATPVNAPASSMERSTCVSAARFRTARGVWSAKTRAIAARSAMSA